MTETSTTHGTLTAYRRGCRCSECSAKAGAYQKRLRFEHQRGTHRLVSTDKCHAHLNWLRSEGMSWADIAKEMGYTASPTVHRIMRKDRVRRTTANRLLSIRPARSSDRALMDSAGSVRRLQALACMGWSNAELSRRTGIHQSVLSEIRLGNFTTTRGTVARQIAEQYEELAYVDGGSARARTAAKRGKWAPPAAWDDIDNPKAKPQGVAR